MSEKDLIESSEDMTHDLVGVFLGCELRAYYVKRFQCWQCYQVHYGPNGGITSCKVLRTKDDGKPVRVVHHWEGVSDLAEWVTALYHAKKLKLR